MLKITWFGTATIKFDDKKNSLIFDPFIRIDKRNNDYFIKKMSKVKNIFITHGHIDHTMDLPIIFQDKVCNIHCTLSPYRRLIKEGINKNNLKLIKPTDNIKIGDFDITVLKGKHIRFNLGLIIKTIFNKNIIKYSSNLLILIKAHFKHKEAHETISYYIKHHKMTFLLLGSMALDKNTNYPTNVDYLILPFQGRSDLNKKVVPLLQKIKPKNIILSHFDNSFPPISTTVDISYLPIITNNKINLIIPKYDTEILIKKKEN